jgi:hypothetical protein
MILRRGARPVTPAYYALVANNCRWPISYNNSSQWVHNCWTKHRAGPTGFKKGVYALFVNGITITNGEVNAGYDFNLRCGIYVNGKFTRGVWLSNSASVDSLLARTWGYDVAFFDVEVPPNTDFYITNRRAATDNGAAGTYSVITNTAGATKRVDGVMGGTDLAVDFTLGVGVAYGAKALAPVINAAGAITSIPIDPNNKGTGYTLGGSFAVDYGPSGINKAGSLVPGLTGPGGYTNPSGGGVGSITITAGGTGMNYNEPPAVYVGGVGTPGSGFGNTTASYGPSCIFGAPDGDSLSVILFGDSITAGYGSVDATGDVNGNFGCYEQALQNKCGVMVSAQSGDSFAGTITNYTKRKGILQYLYNLGLRIDKFVLAFGANDFNQNANSDVLSFTQSGAAQWIVMIKAIFPEAAAITTTVPPECTSTDGFITTANQTPITIGFGGTPNFAAGSRVAQYNAAILNGTGVAGQDGFIDIAGTIGDPTTPSKWRVAGEFYLAAVTAAAFCENDGVHPSVAAGIPYLVANLDMSHVLKPTPQRTISRPQRNYVAQKGEAGEYKFRNVDSTAAVALTTGTPTNVASIVLTAGDWELSASLDFALTGATITKFKGSTSKISATHGKDDQMASNLVNLTTITDTQAIAIPGIKVTVPERATATYYLVAEAAFSAGTVAAYGKLKAKAL